MEDEKRRGGNLFMSTQQSSETPDSWKNFCVSRIPYLTSLASTVEAGVRRQDTTHPAFCGCIDWHSSVHGTYALLTAARLTGESRWVDVVESMLTPEHLEGELLSLEVDVHKSQARVRTIYQFDHVSVGDSVHGNLDGWKVSLEIRFNDIDFSPERGRKKCH